MAEFMPNKKLKRLVDADALMPLFIQKACTMEDRHGVELGEEWLLNYNDIKDVIDNAPTFESPWIPVGERLPEGKIDPLTNDFELVLCSTVWGIVRPLKFGKPIGHAKAHFWNGGSEMDIYVTAWMPLPEGYKEGDNKWL